MFTRYIAISVVALLMTAGCTFVQTTPKGNAVRVASGEEVVNCQRIGQINVSTLSRVAGLPRYESSMQDELSTLARNSGADMGGDTVAPATPIKDGKQTFIVYRCKATAQ